MTENILFQRESFKRLESRGLYNLFTRKAIDGRQEKEGWRRHQRRKDLQEPLCCLPQLQRSRSGPNLKGVVGSEPASKEGFGYSSAHQGLKGKKWNNGNLDKYLKSPADYAPGNAMAFAGLANAKDRADVIAYLSAN